MNTMKPAAETAAPTREEWEAFDRVTLTAVRCPRCHQTVVVENRVHDRRLRTCSWCGACWTPTS
jgi:hypothetical protein